jgi:hypothetical protein
VLNPRLVETEDLEEVIEAPIATEKPWIEFAVKALDRNPGCAIDESDVSSGDLTPERPEATLWHIRITCGMRE